MSNLNEPGSPISSIVIEDPTKDLKDITIDPETVAIALEPSVLPKSPDGNILSPKSMKSPKSISRAQTAQSHRSNRSLIEEQSIAVRIMNNRYFRFLYHLGSRSVSFIDQITDILLLFSLFASHQNSQAHAYMYLGILISPYVVLSLLLLSPISRRSPLIDSMLFYYEYKDDNNDDANDNDGTNDDDDNDVRKIRLSAAIASIFWIPLYLSFAIPFLICLDLYVYIALLGADLATTRYLIYYWRLKVIVEILFEAIPQTIFILSVEFRDINPILLAVSLCSSLGILAWSMLKIYKGGRDTSLGTWPYFKSYYIEQGYAMIPYLEAITANNLQKLELSEQLQYHEWKCMADGLFYNYSVCDFEISKQNDLSFKLWSLLFYSLENNNLRSFCVNKCKLFQVFSQERMHTMQSIQSMQPINENDCNQFDSVLMTAFDRQKSDISQASSVASHMFSRSMVLHSISKMIQASSSSLKIIKITHTNLGTYAPALITTLSSCCSLSELHLSNNNLSNSKELETAFESLFSNQKINWQESNQFKILNLDSNCFGDDMANKFAHIFTENEEKVLDMLSLDGNQITLFGAKALMKAANTSDVAINLENNKIDTQQWNTLMAKTLQNMY